MPLTLQHFEELIQQGCAKSREILSETWVFQCAKLIGDRRAIVEEMMPHSEVILTYILVFRRSLAAFRFEERLLNTYYLVNLFFQVPMTGFLCVQ